MKRAIIIKSVLLASVVSIASVQPALAYIDPNTGGQLFQLLAVVFAFLSAILLFLSSYIRMGLGRLKRFLRSSSTSDPREKVLEKTVSEGAQNIQDPGLEPGP